MLYLGTFLANLRGSTQDLSELWNNKPYSATLTSDMLGRGFELLLNSTNATEPSLDFYLPVAVGKRDGS